MILDFHSCTMYNALFALYKHDDAEIGCDSRKLNPFHRITMIVAIKTLLSAKQNKSFKFY